MRYAFFRNGDALTRARISAHARWSAVHRKTAKTTNLNPVTAHQRVANRIENGLDSVLSIAVRQLAKASCQFFYKIASCLGGVKRYKE